MSGRTDEELATPCGLKHAHVGGEEESWGNARGSAEHYNKDGDGVGDKEKGAGAKDANRLRRNRRQAFARQT